MTKRWPLLGVFAALCVDLACGCSSALDPLAKAAPGSTGSSPSDDAGVPVFCSPGLQIECRCQGGEVGTQTCEADGRNFGACTDCVLSSSGGGSGSSSGSSGGGSSSGGSSSGGSSSGGSSSGGSSSGGNGSSGGSSSGGSSSGGSSSGGSSSGGSSSGGSSSGGSSSGVSSGGGSSGGSSSGGSSSGGSSSGSGGSSSGGSSSGGSSSGGSSSGGSSSGGSSSGGSSSGGPVDCSTGTVGTACTPEALGACVPGYIAPAKQSTCTATDLTTFYTNCFTNGTSCDGTGLSNAACATCLLSQSTSTSSWGAVVEYPDSSFTFNLGGCFALIGSTLACAEAEQEQGECEVAACESSCPATADITTCITSADTGVCATYVSAVTANCSSTITGSTACGAGATTDETAFQAIGATFCE